MTICCPNLTCQTIIAGALTRAFLLVLLELIKQTKAGPIRTKASLASAQPLQTLVQCEVVEAGSFTHAAETSCVIHKRFYLLRLLLKVPLPTREVTWKLL